MGRITKAARRLLAMKSGDVTRGQLAGLYTRSGGRCRYCGAVVKNPRFNPRNPKGFDHVLPISKGGRHTIKNLSIACTPCNLAKGNRTEYEPGDFAVWLRRRSITVLAFCLRLGWGGVSAKKRVAEWSAGAVIPPVYLPLIRRAYPKFPARLVS